MAASESSPSKASSSHKAFSAPHPKAAVKAIGNGEVPDGAVGGVVPEKIAVDPQVAIVDSEKTAADAEKIVVDREQIVEEVKKTATEKTVADAERHAAGSPLPIARRTESVMTTSASHELPSGGAARKAAVIGREGAVGGSEEGCRRTADEQMRLKME